MLLVTGGAGFIGSNFVLVHGRAGGRAGRQPRQAHLRRQPEKPGGPARRCAPHVRAGRHLRPRAGAQAARSSTGRAPSCTSPPRATSTARSTGPAEFVQTNVVGTFCLLEEARAYWQQLAGARARGVPLPARLHRRGLRLARARRSRVHRGHALRAEQPLQRLQGRLRPPGARLPPHLRPADAHHELLQQLRAAPVPGEADPADDPQRARRQAAAGVRRRPQRARLALRGGPLRRAARGARARAARARCTTSAAARR